jgi:hypothetical protein
VRHPTYKDRAGRSRPCLINDVLYAESLQGNCVYTGLIQVRQIISYDRLIVDFLDWPKENTMESGTFDHRRAGIQAGYTHDLHRHQPLIT